MTNFPTGGIQALCNGYNVEEDEKKKEKEKVILQAGFIYFFIKNILLFKIFFTNFSSLPLSFL